jgi:hypothetical protein
MVIIENSSDLKYLQQIVDEHDSFWIPVYSDAYKHYTQNQISFIYIYSIKRDKEFIFPARHYDCLSLDIEHVQHLTSQADIYILAKKRFKKFYPHRCYDADLMAWWQTGAMLPLNETNTAAHDIWNRWWHNETDINDWLPITKHIERCQSMRKEFMNAYSQFKMSDEFRRYDELAIDTFAKIEQVGLQIDTDIFKEKFQTNGIHDNKVYTEYNLYTTTGRPSNKFGGINYAALNKEDGSREAFQSRFEDGFLLEYDYDAFHVRLIADLIKYQLPYESVHTYFGRQYFNKPELSDDEYDQSKQITFRLLYGGIDKDFEQIPFFGETKKYIQALWKSFNRDGYVTTPLLHRRLRKSQLPDMNANKLFNYMLQATETEHNMVILNKVNTAIKRHNSKLILYTYDSLLFDYDMNDGRRFIIQMQNILSEHGKFPVKIKAGTNYHAMSDMTSRVI